jgi:hypothetical protein
MSDILYLLITFFFFAASLALVEGLDRLGKG